jgi:hypothetical protein
MGNAGITLEHCLNLDSGYICVNPESMHLVLVPFRIRKTDSMLTRPRRVQEVLFVQTG